MRKTVATISIPSNNIVNSFNVCLVCLKVSLELFTQYTEFLLNTMEQAELARKKQKEVMRL